MTDDQLSDVGDCGYEKRKGELHGQLVSEVEARMKESGLSLDERVREVMMAVPRHKFVPDKYFEAAYHNKVVPTNLVEVKAQLAREGIDPVRDSKEYYREEKRKVSTASEPFLVATMVGVVLGENPEEKRALDVGCGTGYQTAVMSGLFGEVVGVEIKPEVAEKAVRNLSCYVNVEVVVGSVLDLEDEVGFDAVVVAAEVSDVEIFSNLVDLTRVGGLVVAPMGVGLAMSLSIDRESQDELLRRSREIGEVVVMMKIEKMEGGRLRAELVLQNNQAMIVSFLPMLKDGG